jgi:hypothetical protein
MPAPASQLASLLDHLAEERGTVRRPCRIGVVCRSAAASELPVRATLRNVSGVGVRLDSAHRYQAGAVLRVEVPALPGLPAGRCLEVRVAYSVNPEAGREWVHGCYLVGDGLSEDELRALAWRVLPGAAYR